MDEITQQVIEKFPVEIKKVDINSIFANKWNPNNQSDLVFKSLVNSIKTIGFTVPILVRQIENGCYEIIDGEHKWKGAQELGYKEVLIADMGVVEDSLAKTLTITMNNVRGQDDILKRAELLKQIKESNQPDLFGLLPMQEKELEEQMALLDFDFSQYEKGEVGEEDKSRAEKVVTLLITLDREARKLHSEIEDTNTRLALEQLFELIKVLKNKLLK